jgi:hypothetical protein
MTAGGIAATAVVLMLASAFDVQLGLPTCAAGLVTMTVVAVMLRSSPWRFLREVSWGVIPLVAGLFVLVQALDRSGAIHALGDYLKVETQRSTMLTAAGSGILVGLVSNLINNLPAGLIAGMAVQAANVPPDVSSAVLIGVDLGPNLGDRVARVILWLTACAGTACTSRRGTFSSWACSDAPALLAALGGSGCRADPCDRPKGPQAGRHAGSVRGIYPRFAVMGLGCSRPSLRSCADRVLHCMRRQCHDRGYAAGTSRLRIRAWPRSHRVRAFAVHENQVVAARFPSGHGGGPRF